MKQFLFLLAFSSWLFYAKAQTEVEPFRPGITENGITYFLPKTKVRVAVHAVKTHFEPGEFSSYAERFLRLRNVTQIAYDEWKITAVELQPYGVADSSKAFSIKFKQKTTAPFVTLAKDGRLLAINTQATEEPELIEPSVTKNEEKQVNGADYKTEEILSAGSTTKMAELTAAEIYDIRENRGLLTTGQADFMPADGVQLKLMLENLDTREEALLQLFKGTATSETHVFVFDLEPETSLEKELLFRFSKHLGVVDNDDPAGSPVYVSIKDLETLPTETFEENAKAKKEPEDLRYVLPSRVKVRIFTDTRELASRSFPMAQFGRIEHLGGELFNKKFTTTLKLSGQTGGIEQITGE